MHPKRSAITMGHFRPGNWTTAALLYRWQTTNDRYLVGEFDLLLCNVSNALFRGKALQAGLPLIENPTAIEWLMDFYQVETAGELIRKAYDDWRLCLPVTIADTDGVIPRTPVVLMEKDLNWFDADAFGIEGTGSYGAGVARFLTSRGHTVVEVNRPDRSTRYRKGKSDPTDAEMAARAVLAGVADATPESGEGEVEMIRMFKSTKDSAVKARTQAINQMKALVVTAPARLREHLTGLTAAALVTRSKSFRPGRMEGPTAAAKYALRSLARRYRQLGNEIKDLEAEIQRLTRTAAPALVDGFGIGPDTAATLLIAAGSNPDRLHSEAAFASLCGVNPIPASSGKTNRHRLNRGGPARPTRHSIALLSSDFVMMSGPRHTCVVAPPRK